METKKSEMVEKIFDEDPIKITSSQETSFDRA